MLKSCITMIRKSRAAFFYFLFCFRRKFRTFAVKIVLICFIVVIIRKKNMIPSWTQKQEQHVFFGVR